MSKAVHVRAMSLFSIMVFFAPGCSNGRESPVVVRNDPSMESKASNQAADEPKDAKETEKEERKKAKKRREQEHKLARLQRDLESARLKAQKAEVELHFSDVAGEAAVAKAEADVRDATRDLSNFRQHVMQSRLGWAQLGLERSTDRAGEDQEELAQLEMMYADEQLEDRTKEIVLGRGQRRLERSQRDLELRQKDFTNLREHELPSQEKDLEQKLTNGQRSLEQARHNAVVGNIDKRIKHIEALSAIEKIEFEIAELEREMAEAEEDE